VINWQFVTNYNLFLKRQVSELLIKLNQALEQNLKVSLSLTNFEEFNEQIQKIFLNNEKAKIELIRPGISLANLSMVENNSAKK